MDMHYPYQLPPLPYAYEALSPNISGDTLRFHHDKHFQTYVDNLNTALADCPECQSKPLDELLKNLDRLPDPKRTAIRNNGGGVYNHLLYFDGMCACHSSRPSGGLAMAMERDFGSFEGWKEQMKAAALGQFGSGYAWLVSETSGKLSVMKLPNQDCPLSMGLWPVLCLDVWEHAYYLDYQNRRAEYVDRWFERIKTDLIACISEDNTRGEYYLDQLMVAKYLERIGDHATNIAEWVEYSILGRRSKDGVMSE